jgi:HPt (histidine-containing phosphotransfer) domain-containing protein
MRVQSTNWMPRHPQRRSRYHRRAGTTGTEGLEEGKPDPVVEMLELFCRNTESALTTLKDALDRDDVSAVRRTAHSLRGGSDVIGIRQLAAISAELEQKVGRGSLHGVEEIVNQIEGELHHVRKAFADEKAHDRPENP